ncbi:MULTISPECIES: phosphate ABC transporter substrate-binding/OmpA family protein [unclassified Yoonia]|uniref:phosphate ABC transporter substrate-binding/OmpA family protein n=1 Tax=unclassified Yoonia TaxID=2629118 RepID=UPI002AFFAB20|nr:MULTISPECIES: phosphate ABC transporter substrate-binding/OmpA family protein [unclassified Yoonia]
MTKQSPFRWPATLALGTGVCLSLATALAAQDVTLNSLDGELTLRGELLSYDGSVYVLGTVFGSLEVNAFLVTCEGEACPEIDTTAEAFAIAGSSGLVNGVFSDLITAFSAEVGGAANVTEQSGDTTVISLLDEAQREAATITLAAVGSTQGIADVIADNAALAISTRAVSQAEAQAFANAGKGDPTSEGQQTIFALDALVAITSLSNPVRAISEADLARIFAGEVTNWADVGGPSAQINVYGRAADSGTSVVFNELVMEPAGLRVSDTILRTETDAALAQAVASDPLGIGVTSLADAGDAKILAVRGVCGIQVQATPFTIKTEEYPLSRRLYAYTDNETAPAQLTRLMQFLETPAAQAVVSDAGYVDLGISFQSNNEQGLRYLASILTDDVEVTLPQLREMTQSLTAADRSSITFRFALGSSRLDARAQDDIVRLANLIATSDISNKELLLIGYTDSIGDGAANLALSQQRAEEVRQALLAVAPSLGSDDLPVRALGFGEISPLSCNETDNGRRINRRVEVWLRDVVTESR